MEFSPNVDTIGNSLVQISRDVTMRDMLMALDEVLEEAGVYAYQNWIKGELCDGPHVSRYWFNSTWMWPYAMMPNPDAGLRLTNKGAKVYFYKDVFEEPAKVKGPQDIDTLTKRAELLKHDIWCVKIEMPRKLIDDKLEEIIDLEDTIEISTTDIDDAYNAQEPEVVEQEEAPEDDFGDEELDLEGL